MSTRRTKSGMSIVLSLAAVGVLLYLRDGNQRGREAPDFTVRGVYGDRVELSSFRGRPLLVVFWTTSCGICRRELPIVDRLASEFEGRIETLAVNIGDLEGARGFMRANQLRLANTVDETGEVARRYGVHGVPRLILIGADGKVVKESGSLSEAALRRWLRGALP